MKKFIIPVAILLVCAFIITGCSGTGTPTSVAPTTTASSAPTSNPAQTTAPPKVMTTIATGTPSTTSTVAPPTSSAGTQKYGGVLRIADPSAPGTPIGAPWETSGGSVLSMQLSIEPLLREDLGGKLNPRLAESYDINTDPANPSATFHLRKGVKFQDGTDFNAQAAKWNFEMTKAGGLTAPATNFWKSFDVIDDYTLRVNFTEWQNRLMRSFGDSVAYIVSPTAYQKNGIDWIRWRMVGTGPFKQLDFQRDSVLKTGKYENYWDTGKPYVDEVDYIYVMDPMTREALFKSGGADIATCNPVMASNLQNAGYKIITRPEGPYVLVPDSLNTDSPWSNPKVRLALEYSIDREALAKTFGYGFTRPAYQVPSSASMAYDPDLKPRMYDVAKAKQLMADAGYPGGFKTRIVSSTSDDRNYVAALQAFMAKIGIQADIEIAEPASYQKYTSGGPWKNALVLNPFQEWANYNTTLNNFFNPKSNWYQSLNKPPSVADLVAQSVKTPAQDATVLKKVADALYDDVTVIPLTYNTSLWATNEKFQDTGYGTRGMNAYWNPQNAWMSK